MARVKKRRPADSAALRRAGYDVLRPLVRLLRTTGLSTQDLKRLTARAIRETAGEQVRGVAVEPAIFELIAEVPAVWRQETPYVDQSGQPRPLSLAGPDSFTTICQQVSRRLDPAQALKLLTDFGSVEQQSDGQLLLISTMTRQTHQGRVLSIPVLNDTQHYLETVEHNACDRGTGRGLMQSRASHGGKFAPGTFEAVHDVLRRSGTAFLEDSEKEMAAYALGDSSSGERYGVGVYVYRVSDPNAQPTITAAPRRPMPRSRSKQRKK